MPNAVVMVPAAASAVAVRHFEAEFTFETDCWDTHEALRDGDPGFVLLDVRSPALFETGHISGAVSLPYGKIVASRMSEYVPGTLFVTYCSGPHCNAAAHGALRVARLGYPVKIMTGGVVGWLNEGFPLVPGDERE